MPPHRLFGARHQVPWIPPVPRPAGRRLSSSGAVISPACRKPAKKKGLAFPPGNARPWHPYRAPDQPLFSLVDAPRRWPR